MNLEFKLTDAGVQQVRFALMKRITVLRKRQERLPSDAERLEALILELEQVDAAVRRQSSTSYSGSPEHADEIVNR